MTSTYLENLKVPARVHVEVIGLELPRDVLQQLRSIYPTFPTILETTKIVEIPYIAGVVNVRQSSKLVKPILRKILNETISRIVNPLIEVLRSVGVEEPERYITAYIVVDSAVSPVFAFLGYTNLSKKGEEVFTYVPRIGLGYWQERNRILSV